jgi:aminoglycoside/choline kinase family phosphotransferase
MESYLSQILRQRLHISEKILSLIRLHGDASYRTYYRLLLDGGRSLIVMQLPPGKSSVSEEITNLKEKPPELPFVNIGRFLKEKGLPVPSVYHYDETAGLLLIEDLGDETLETRLPRCSPEERKSWYQKAVDLLVLFQKKGMERDGCIAHKRSFDETLLNWEFDHFVEYGIEARTGVRPSEEDLKKIRQGTNFITFALTRLPQTLTHRDFQSRNLMIQDETLKLLDFQDALMGPYLYDLVALLRDSYVTLPWTLVEELIAYYLQCSSETPSKGIGSGLARPIPPPRGLGGGPEVSPAKMFDWMTIQRKLKDAGRFVYIDRVKGNPNFLKHIPNSLSYVREAFERQPELKALFEILKKYVPEFQ